jgi:hypothetical protein
MTKPVAVFTLLPFSEMTQQKYLLMTVITQADGITNGNCATALSYQVPNIHKTTKSEDYGLYCAIVRIYLTSTNL